MKKLRTKDKWFSFLLVFSWLLVCNLPVAETLFVMLHDSIGAHEDAHEHHTDHHAGHSVPHEHEGTEQKPHGMSSVHYVRLSNDTSITDGLSPLTSYISILLNPPIMISHGEILSSLCAPYNDCRFFGDFDVRSITSRAPPTFL